MPHLHFIAFQVIVVNFEMELKNASNQMLQLNATLYKY